MSNGKFLAKDNSIPAGQEIVADLLNRCLKWAEIVLTRFDPYYLIDATHKTHCCS